MDNFGCNDDSSTFKKCDKFGTFSAADANCINTSTPADGSIIPFSSGNTQSIINEMVDVKTAKNLAGFFILAFTVPQEGTITAISASFTIVSGQIF
ncbi:hypothetical protein ACQKNB_18465 [Lysinibacillus xylanilyticus]|uniref:hypothetical protein n=1 Tax=Lysinibacillus xylanilyticus TaxID=582475 RepID=UPI003D02EE78